MNKIKYAAERIATWRLAIELLHLMHLIESVDGPTRRHWGAHVGQALVEFAIVIGQAEGKPMSATKIAAYVGLPRPTVIRHIKALKEAGIVQQIDRTKLVVPVERLNDGLRLEVLADAAVKIKATATKLSKMDTERLPKRNFYV